MKPNREQLLGFLLDALDDAEREQVEQQLQQDPELQQELESLQATLEPLEDSYGEYEPPPTLAERTCALVTGHANAERSAGASMAGAAPAAASGRFTLADTMVAAGIFLAAGMLFFPAILNGRYLARITSCQHNLSNLGMALANYSDLEGRGFYPCIPSEGKSSFSGLYAPILQQGGHLPDPGRIICPSDPLAQQLKRFRIPTLQEVDRADQARIVMIRRHAGGSYGFNLGFVVDGRHSWPRRQGRAHFVLMADAPNPWMGLQSTHHGGRGQNLLYDDGHVRFVSELHGEHCLDHPFQNHFGLLEAGVNENDAVIAPSFWAPLSRGVTRPLPGK